MRNIFIIGGGFAGISAAATLRKLNRGINITLIDKKDKFNFLPLLPDVLGRGINPEFLSNNLSDICRRRNVKFIKDEIGIIDLVKKEISGSKDIFSYDYLVIACGSETNFYGNDILKKNCLKLDDAFDAERISKILEADKFDTFIVSGGGYTGIEVATNLRRYFNLHRLNKQIIIIERAPSILGPLPEWMKRYVNENLKRLGIKIYLNSSIEKIENDNVYFSNKESFKKALLIWTAGVKTPDFIFNLDLEKSRQGRLKVDEFLRIDDHCFAIGDAADFYIHDKPIRMAVQFSIAEGETAAKNIINSIKEKPLKSYKPIDLGYIIPMANNSSCGTILGINSKGTLATMMHYIMCVYRSFGFKNKWGIVKCLLKGGRR